MEPRINIITLAVKDLELMRTFYEKTLAWEIEFANEGVAFFKLNGILLGLFPEEGLANDAGIPHEEVQFKPFSLAYNCRSEKEVDELIQSLKNSGVKILKEPQKVFWGGYSSYFSDPEGNLWEVAYNPFMTLDEAGNVLGHES